MASELPIHLQQTLTGHEGSVLSVRFTGDGQYCLSGGRDKLVRLWNPQTGLLIKAYKGHGFEVNDAVASLDNSRIASGSADKHAFVWDVSTGTVTRRFRGHTGIVNAVRFSTDATVRRQTDRRLRQADTADKMKMLMMIKRRRK